MSPEATETSNCVEIGPNLLLHTPSSLVVVLANGGRPSYLVDAQLVQNGKYDLHDSFKGLAMHLPDVLASLDKCNFVSLAFHHDLAALVEPETLEICGECKAICFSSPIPSGLYEYHLTGFCQGTTRPLIKCRGLRVYGDRMTFVVFDEKLGEVQQVHKTPVLQQEPVPTITALQQESMHKSPVVQQELMRKSPVVQQQSIQKSPLVQQESVQKSPLVQQESVQKSPVTQQEEPKRKVPAILQEHRQQQPVVQPVVQPQKLPQTTESQSKHSAAQLTQRSQRRQSAQSVSSAPQVKLPEPLRHANPSTISPIMDPNGVIHAKNSDEVLQIVGPFTYFHERTGLVISNNSQNRPKLFDPHLLASHFPNLLFSSQRFRRFHYSNFYDFSKDRQRKNYTIMEDCSSFAEVFKVEKLIVCPGCKKICFLYPPRGLPLPNSKVLQHIDKCPNPHHWPWLSTVHFGYQTQWYNPSTFLILASRDTDAELGPGIRNTVTLNYDRLLEERQDPDGAQHLRSAWQDLTQINKATSGQRTDHLRDFINGVEGSDLVCGDYSVKEWVIQPCGYEYLESYKNSIRYTLLQDDVAQSRQLIEMVQGSGLGIFLPRYMIRFLCEQFGVVHLPGKEPLIITHNAGTVQVRFVDFGLLMEFDIVQNELGLHPHTQFSMRMRFSAAGHGPLYEDGAQIASVRTWVFDLEGITGWILLLPFLVGLGIRFMAEVKDPPAYEDPRESFTHFLICGFDQIQFRDPVILDGVSLSLIEMINSER